MIGTALPASVDYRDADWGEPLLLLMGNEQAGLTPALMAAADSSSVCPCGRSDSRSTAVATGVILYEWQRHTRQRAKIACPSRYWRGVVSRRQLT